jgi:D-alanyl-D-alanine endopeptidase (penicillin-binding protein 7)
MRPVNNKPYSWFGLLALVSLVSIAAAPAEGARKPPSKSKSAASSSSASDSTPAATPSKDAKPSTAYSAARAQARKAALARARAAAMARETATLPRYKFDDAGVLVPDLHAEAAVIYDPETNQVLWEQNSQTQRSIASITKVMTATVFLENDPNLSEVVTLTRSDLFQASTTRLRVNDQVTTDDLLHLMLIASDNAAARALARVSSYGSEGFVQRMNEKASELGLEMTNYADPSGLLSDNVSSAYDMARLITLASNDERISSIMRVPEYTLYTVKHRAITFRSTDHLLGLPDIDVRAAKTGFISKSGYCLATLLQMPQGGQQVAVVVLGARSNAGRFLETRNLFQWLSSKATTVLGSGVSPTSSQLPQIQ